MISAKVAPPYSLVIVEDAGGGSFPDPETLRHSPIVATDSCIAIGCLMAQDGETEITLGPTRQVDSGSPPAFQGTLNTPTGRVAVRTVLLTTILEMSVPLPTTAIRVWVNHPTEPDKVIVGVE